MNILNDVCCWSIVSVFSVFIHVYLYEVAGILLSRLEHVNLRDLIEEFFEGNEMIFEKCVSVP